MKIKDKYFGICPRIAQWHIDSPIERFLGEHADESEFWKRLYVSYYRRANPAYYRGGVQMAMKYVEQYATDLSSNQKEAIIRDMIYSLHRFGTMFDEYWIFHFPHLNTLGRNAFVSCKLSYHYIDLVNKPEILPLTVDKYQSYLRWKPFYKREVVQITSNTDFDAFIQFIQHHDKFIFKPLTGSCGKGISIIESAEIRPEAFFNSALAEFNGGVVEELIEQGEETAVFHPQSLNSLRVTTFTIGKDVHILQAGLRIGMGESVVDNASAGGMHAVINPGLGIIDTDAITYTGRHYAVHPDTGVQIVGYKLPKWDEALKFINSIATAVDGATLMSWDIAYSRKGWLIVEVNDNGDATLMQMNKLEGKKAELYRLMDKFFLKNTSKQFN